MNAENSQELLEEKTGTATDAHAAKVSGLFARIVKWYDPLNRLLSLGLDQGWRKCLADAVLPGQTEGKRVLDLAAGTLDVTLAVRKRHPAAQVLAMDFCPPMLVHPRSVDYYGTSSVACLPYCGLQGNGCRPAQEFG